MTLEQQSPLAVKRSGFHLNERLTPEQTGQQRRARRTVRADETGPCRVSLPGAPQSCVPAILAGHMISATQSRERRAEGAGEGRDGRGPQAQARPLLTDAVAGNTTASCYPRYQGPDTELARG